MKHRSLIRGIPAIAALVVLACGCASGPGEPRRDDGALFLNVVEREDLGAEWACANPGFCIEDYKEFLRIAASHSNPVPASEIWKRLREIDSGNVPTIPGPLSADTLRDAVTDSLNIRFLLDGIDARPLVVTTIGKTETADDTEYRLLFEETPGWACSRGFCSFPEAGARSPRSGPSTDTTTPPRSFATSTTARNTPAGATRSSC